MKSGANSVASYSYDYVGNRDVTTLGNGTSTEYAYDTDPRYRLDTITHKKGANTLATIDYTDTARDNAGNPKSMTDWTGTWDYDYDDNNRLINATPPNPVPDQPAGGDYGYDWVGNRLNPPTGTNHMVYNKADQLTTWPGIHTYTYYGDGSLHEVKDASGTNVLRSYTYTPDGLLESASYNSRTLTNTWDADKNRVSFTAGGNTHTFVYDPTAGIPAVIQEDSVYYVREPNGRLIARISGTDRSYYHFDALGSTRLLSDGDGDITDRYAYDAYGSLIAHDEFTGSVDQPYQYVGQLGYYTHYQEPDFGLVQLGVRFYDTEVGRFTSRDEFASFRSSSYSYVSGKPTRATDPSGLVTVVDPGGYQTCAASACYNGSNARVEVTEYQRTVERLDKWAFSKCLASEFGPDAATFAVCFTLSGCWKLIPVPPLFAACVAGCLEPGPGDEDALEKVMQCYKKSKKWVTETMSVSCCTSGGVTYCNKNQPDPASGWKPVK